MEPSDINHLMTIYKRYNFGVDPIQDGSHGQKNHSLHKKGCRMKVHILFLRLYKSGLKFLNIG